MQTKELLKILGKGVGVGVGATALGDGGLVLYHCVRNFIEFKQPPAPVVEECLMGWFEANHTQMIQIIWSLAVLFPASLLGGIYFLLTRKKADQREPNEHSILVENNPTTTNKCADYTSALFKGIIIGFISLGLIGGGLRIFQITSTRLLRDSDKDPTVEQCYKEWMLERTLNFTAALTIFFAGTLIASFIFALKICCNTNLQEEESNHRSAAPSLN